MAEHTKEELFAIGKEAGLDESSLLELFRKHAIKPPFSVDKWGRYIKAIETFKNIFCEICGARFVIDYKFDMHRDHLRCPTDKTHTVASHVATLIEGFEGCSREEALERAQGPICEHGLKLLYCEPCVAEAKHIKIDMIRAEEENG